MPMTSDPVVRCQRCGKPGATSVYGWALLCRRCKNSDDDWYEDRMKAWNLQPL